MCGRLRTHQVAGLHEAGGGLSLLPKRILEVVLRWLLGQVGRLDAHDLPTVELHVVPKQQRAAVGRGGHVH